MAVIKEGGFELDFRLLKLRGTLWAQDRQCAWQLYAEIVTRVAVTGKRRDYTCKDFSGEVIAESFASLHAFFQEARKIMKQFPVGKIKKKHQSHLGTLIQHILTNALRPFLEKWQADFRAWWKQEEQSGGSWFDIQKKYPQYEELLSDWTDLRLFMRKIEDKIRDEYRLQNIDSI